MIRLKITQGSNHIDPTRNGRDQISYLLEIHIVYNKPTKFNLKHFKFGKVAIDTYVSKFEI